MKKLSLLTVFSVVCLLLFNVFILTCNVSANPDNITIIVNGEMMEFGTDANDPYPYIKEGRTLIPFRRIFEKLQMEVTWDNETRTVHAKNETTVMELGIGRKTAIVNGEEHTLDVAPEITDDRTFVPLRFVSESVGADVDWDAATRTVTITFLIDSPAKEIPGGPGGGTVKAYKLGEQASYGDKVFTVDEIGERDKSGRAVITGTTNFASTDMYVEIYSDIIGASPFKTQAYTSKVDDGKYVLRIFHYQASNTPIRKIVVLLPDDNGNKVAVAEYTP
jgi:hypothetical protein